MAGKFYVTTSIPYVNGEPHIGHAMEFVQADVLARYHRAQGEDVLFSTGTDEHGGKVMETAKAEGMEPREFVDKLSQSFKQLGVDLDVKYDRFIRTTDEQHEKAAKQIWEKLKPYIYQSTYSGMYDQKEETFLAEEEARGIEKTDPKRYAKLQKLEEKNYFFKLSEFGDRIKSAIESDEFRIVPETRKNEIMALLNSGLEDISISRPKEKIPWGIDVPGDSDQTMYVWFEAVMNYITVLGYPDGKDMKKYWPADVQVIGKDIIRFHAAIWPAMLLALDLPLAKNLYVHGFITMDGKTMSKTVGNVVAPSKIAGTYGSDAARYYLLRHIPSYNDGDFSWEKFENAYNNELGNDLGNLVQRLASMITKYQEGVIGEIVGDQHDEGPYHDAMEDMRFDKALEFIWHQVHGLNQYIDTNKPWQLAKGQDPEHLRKVLAAAVANLLQVSKLLEPFLPNSAAAIDKIFHEGAVRSFKGVLFPRIDK